MEDLNPFPTEQQVSGQTDAMQVSKEAAFRAQT
jgi:hypothetical protein